MSKIKLTFGIPLYNCEKYIDDLMSCFNFDLNYDFEVIVVNDGSTDLSLSILNNYKNSKLRIINKKNGGVSSARNMIINESKGNWLTFIDADDIIDFKKYLYYFNNINNNDDFVICVTNECDYKYLCKHSDNTIPYLIEKGIINSPCMRFYKTEILKKNNILFDNSVSLGEDALFNFTYCTYVSNISFFSDNIYEYRRINNNSLSLKYRNNKIDELIYVNEMSKMLCKNKKEQKALAYVRLGNCRSCVMDIYKFPSVFNTYQKKIDYFRKIRRFSKTNFFCLNNIKYSLEYWMWLILPAFVILFAAKIKTKKEWRIL